MRELILIKKYPVESMLVLKQGMRNFMSKTNFIEEFGSKEYKGVDEEFLKAEPWKQKPTL